MPTPALDAVVAPPGGEVRLPEDYPAWARSLATQYFSRTTCMFALHGNVHDHVRLPSATDGMYGSLPDFLATELFGTWDVVLLYDLGKGLRLLAGSSRERLQKMLAKVTPLAGGPPWPRDPEGMLAWLDQFLERNLLIEGKEGPLSVAVVFAHAEYLLPPGETSSLSPSIAARLVRFLGWSQNPYLKRVNVAFCLLAESLSDLNDRLVDSPYVAAVNVPLPAAAERQQFAAWIARDKPLSELTTYSIDELTAVSNGLSLVSLNLVLSQAKYSGERVAAERFRALKKSLIERQCQGLVEFVEPKLHLDLVVGHAAAKARLRGDGELIQRGRLDMAPMGYLICGPVGTGKTFMAECYAGTIGIPCVTLKNFRSKYVGETEGNLERVLGVLRSLGPVVVIIDEADAALGSRQAEGDSGTSSRVFGMIARQMGDTQYRGKIVWMLLTSRPDALPIDLKRQGRAEVHIPLFYPHDDAELKEMFVVLAKKNKITLAPEAIPPAPKERWLSGADIESIVLAARRLAFTAGREEVAAADLESAFRNFIPSAQGLEKEGQELAAVLECTQLDFLPPDWRARVTEPDGRAQLQQRLSAIRQLLDD